VNVDGFLVAPMNDYRELAESADLADPDASVVIPVFNRARLLDNVLGGLARQRTSSSFDVTVVDDGSDEDIETVVSAWSTDLDVAYLRQERDGRGAGRARNLGASRSHGQVLFFLDADCIPDPRYIEGHLALHRKAVNLVVTASRRHIDRAVSHGDLDRFEDLLEEAGVEGGTDAESILPDDWRRVFFRRNQALMLGDAAFRAVAGGLMSVHRRRFDEVGGFDPAFRSWGGEDTELGWRLWNAGCFIVPEMRTTVIHQRAEDLEGSEGRAASREAMLSLIADRIPNDFYRKEHSHLLTVPAMTVLAVVETNEEADRAMRETARASFTDTELVIVGPAGATALLRSLQSNPRVTVTDDFTEGVLRSRGAVIAIVDGRSRFDRRLLERAFARFSKPSVATVRVGYRAGSRRLLSVAAIEAVDERSGRSRLPFFALVRRRELLKDRRALALPGSALTAASGRGEVDLLVTDLVDVPDDGGSTAGSLPRMSDLRAAGATEIARGVRRTLRRAPTVPAKDSSPESTDPLVPISYIGLAGHQNLGDDAMLEAVRRLLPWARVEESLPNAAAVMLGGGTLLNADSYYLNKVRRVDGPDNERIVFGTGVRNFSYWGATERFEDWKPFLESALAVGVRGPSSLDDLRAWGFRGEATILGDPALILDRPAGVARVDGRVVVCPVFTNGACWGRDDAAVFASIAATVADLAKAGHEVVMMSAHPGDDRWAIEIMRASGHPDMPYLAGYASTTVAIELLSSADLVIGERLHAVVLAAAVGTPFVAIEYRPKLRDFTRSIDAEQWCIRTDELVGLRDIVEHRQASRHSSIGAVNVLRGRLEQCAGELGAALGVPSLAQEPAGG
jgi:GT2 family glycosyltransferase